MMHSRDQGGSQGLGGICQIDRRSPSLKDEYAAEAGHHVPRW
jgi:hypothetical protein